MGQYHKTVNLDKREYLDPHKLGDGLKLLEQMNSHGGTMAALHLLLSVSNGRGGGDLSFQAIDENYEWYTPDSKKAVAELAEKYVGRWAGDRIAVVGDYAEDGDLPAEHNGEDIYSLCGSRAEAFSEAEHREKNARRAGDETYAGKTADEWRWLAKRLRESDPYTDITDDLVPLVQEACGVKIGGEGWRAKTALSPDLVISVE